MKIRKVYLIGAGPGKADLITVRGLNILKEAEVIIYDYLVDNSILKFAKKDADLVCCDSLAEEGTYKRRSSASQEIINRELIKRAKQGKKVIRLKNGDPSLFGRSSCELTALLGEGIEFEIVPGVTAASAAAAYSGIPLTDRDYASSCIFVTGQEAKGKSLINWKALSSCGTIILYMAVNNLELIVKKLVSAKKPIDTPIAIIQNISLSNQRILKGKLEDIVRISKVNAVRPPAIIIIGEVVNLESSFNWFKKNKRVLFTGLSNERYFLTKNYIHVPLIKIEPLKDYSELDNYIKNIRNFDWIVFTSRYGVKYFFKRITALGADVRILTNIKIAVIGQSTKEALINQGIKADLVPLDESSKGLAKEFKKVGIKKKKLFLPRSDISDKGLEAALSSQGAEITASFAYRNVMPENLPELDLDEFNEFMFTSPSAVRNFKKYYDKVPRSSKTNCIGEVTEKEAKKWQLVN